MRHKGYVAPLMAVAALVVVAAVRADIPVELAYVGVTPGLDVNVYSATPDQVILGMDTGANNHFVVDPSGLIDLATQPDPPALPVPTAMFCLDLQQAREPITSGYPPTLPTYPDDFTTFNLVKPRYAPQPDDEGWAGYPMGATQEAWLTVLAENYWTSTWLDGTTDLNYAAMQVAIWEIVFEGTGGGPTQGSADAGDSPWDALNGDFRVFDLYSNGTTYSTDSSMAGTVANVMLDYIWTEVGANPVELSEEVFLGALVHDEYQDMLVRTTREVPEPTGMALAALGILGLASRRKRRS